MPEHLSPGELRLHDKVLLTARILSRYATVKLSLHRRPLPDLVARLATANGPGELLPGIEPKRLGRMVGRVLNVGRFRTRCLVSALVLYRLLREQGLRPVLVIGLPHSPTDHTAHAWVELDGKDVGPPPGRMHHEPLARYGG